LVPIAFIYLNTYCPRRVVNIVGLHIVLTTGSN
jgi:hypothetical protein